MISCIRSVPQSLRTQRWRRLQLEYHFLRDMLRMRAPRPVVAETDRLPDSLPTLQSLGSVGGGPSNRLLIDPRGATYIIRRLLEHNPTLTHSCSGEGNIVDEGRGKCRHPNHQNQSHHHLVVGWNHLYQSHHYVPNVLDQTKLLQPLQ